MRVTVRVVDVTMRVVEVRVVEVLMRVVEGEVIMRGYSQMIEML